MYRRWKKSDQPIEVQAPDKSIRQRSGPEKGDRSRKSAAGTARGQPSTYLLGGQWQCQTAKRHSYGVAFLAPGVFLSAGIVRATAKIACQPHEFPVV